MGRSDHPGDDAGADAPAPVGGETSRVDRLLAVRRAVDQAVGATADGTRARATDLVDELGTVVGRMRGAIEDLGGAGSAGVGALADEVSQAVVRLGRSIDDVRPASGDELRRAEERIAALEARVAALESAAGTPPPGDDA